MPVPGLPALPAAVGRRVVVPPPSVAIAMPAAADPVQGSPLLHGTDAYSHGEIRP